MYIGIGASKVERKPHTTSARESRVLRCPEMARVLHVVLAISSQLLYAVNENFDDGQGENMARSLHVIIYIKLSNIYTIAFCTAKNCTENREQ